MKKADIVTNYEHLKGKEVVVKMNSGREIQGLLKGYDQVGNIVLDDVEELIYLENNENTNNENKSNVVINKRFLGVVIVRGPHVCLLFPKNTLIETDNPFVI